MKTFKNHKWEVFTLGLLVLFTVLGINQERYREWERIQAQIKIPAEETLQAFKEAGLHLENIEEEAPRNISKARYGEPRSVFRFELMEGKFYVSVFEYRDWKDANLTIDFQIDFRRSNEIPYKGGLFSHGAVAIFIDPPDENLEAQLKKILMDRYNLTKQAAQSR
jgi:hypothetical protein